MPLGQGRFADFFHRGYLIEYHEPRIFADGRSYGDFENRSAYQEFLKAFKRVRNHPWRRQRFLSETAYRLRDNYTHRRRAIIASNPRFQSTPLIVTSSVSEFYYSVILRFQSAHVPSCDEFGELFYTVVRQVARENSPRALRRQRANTPKVAA